MNGQPLEPLLSDEPGLPCDHELRNSNTAASWALESTLGNISASLGRMSFTQYTPRYQLNVPTVCHLTHHSYTKDNVSEENPEEHLQLILPKHKFKGTLEMLQTTTHELRPENAERQRRAEALREGERLPLFSSLHMSTSPSFPGAFCTGAMPHEFHSAAATEESNLEGDSAHSGASYATTGSSEIPMRFSMACSRALVPYTVRPRLWKHKEMWSNTEPTLILSDSAMLYPHDESLIANEMRRMAPPSEGPTELEEADNRYFQQVASEAESTSFPHGWKFLQCPEPHNSQHSSSNIEHYSDAPPAQASIPEQVSPTYYEPNFQMLSVTKNESLLLSPSSQRTVPLYTAPMEHKLHSSEALPTVFFDNTDGGRAPQKASHDSIGYSTPFYVQDQQSEEKISSHLFPTQQTVVTLNTTAMDSSAQATTEKPERRMSYFNTKPQSQSSPTLPNLATCGSQQPFTDPNITNPGKGSLPTLTTTSSCNHVTNNNTNDQQERSAFSTLSATPELPLKLHSVDTHYALSDNDRVSRQTTQPCNHLFVKQPNISSSTSENEEDGNAQERVPGVGTLLSCATSPDHPIIADTTTNIPYQSVEEDTQDAIKTEIPEAPTQFPVPDEDDTQRHDDSGFTTTFDVQTLHGYDFLDCAKKRNTPDIPSSHPTPPMQQSSRLLHIAEEPYSDSDSFSLRRDTTADPSMLCPPPLVFSPILTNSILEPSPLLQSGTQFQTSGPATVQNYVCYPYGSRASYLRPDGHEPVESSETLSSFSSVPGDYANHSKFVKFADYRQEESQPYSMVYTEDLVSEQSSKRAVLINSHYGSPAIMPESQGKLFPRSDEAAGTLPQTRLIAVPHGLPRDGYPTTPDVYSSQGGHQYGRVPCEGSCLSHQLCHPFTLPVTSHYNPEENQFDEHKVEEPPLLHKFMQQITPIQNGAVDVNSALCGSSVFCPDTLPSHTSGLCDTDTVAHDSAYYKEISASPHMRRPCTNSIREDNYDQLPKLPYQSSSGVLFAPQINNANDERDELYHTSYMSPNPNGLLDQDAPAGLNSSLLSTPISSLSSHSHTAAPLMRHSTETDRCRQHSQCLGRLRPASEKGATGQENMYMTCPSMPKNSAMASNTNNKSGQNRLTNLNPSAPTVLPSFDNKQSAGIVPPESPALIEGLGVPVPTLDCLNAEYKKLLKNIPRKSREAFTPSDLAAFRTCHPHYSRNCFILMQNGYDIRLGEVGRAALKKEISRRLKGDSELRERCVSVVCRLKNANVLQLLQMAEISGCLTLGLKISSGYWKEYSKKQRPPSQTAVYHRQFKNDQAISSIVPDNSTSNTPVFAVAGSNSDTIASCRSTDGNHISTPQLQPAQPHFFPKTHSEARSPIRKTGDEQEYEAPFLRPFKPLDVPVQSFDSNNPYLFGNQPIHRNVAPTLEDQNNGATNLFFAQDSSCQERYFDRRSGSAQVSDSIQPASEYEPQDLQRTVSVALPNFYNGIFADTNELPAPLTSFYSQQNQAPIRYRESDTRFRHSQFHQRLDRLEAQQESIIYNVSKDTGSSHEKPDIECDAIDEPPFVSSLKSSAHDNDSSLTSQDISQIDARQSCLPASTAVDQKSLLRKTTSTCRERSVWEATMHDAGRSRETKSFDSTCKKESMNSAARRPTSRSTAALMTNTCLSASTTGQSSTTLCYGEPLDVTEGPLAHPNTITEQHFISNNRRRPRPPDMLSNYGTPDKRRAQVRSNSELAMHTAEAPAVPWATILEHSAAQLVERRSTPGIGAAVHGGFNVDGLRHPRRHYRHASINNREEMRTATVLDSTHTVASPRCRSRWKNEQQGERDSPNNVRFPTNVVLPPLSRVLSDVTRDGDEMKSQPHIHCVTNEDETAHHYNSQLPVEAMVDVPTTVSTVASATFFENSSEEHPRSSICSSATGLPQSPYAAEKHTALLGTRTVLLNSAPAGNVSPSCGSFEPRELEHSSKGATEWPVIPSSDAAAGPPEHSASAKETTASQFSSAYTSLSTQLYSGGYPQSTRNKCAGDNSPPRCIETAEADRLLECANEEQRYFESDSMDDPMNVYGTTFPPFQETATSRASTSVIDTQKPRFFVRERPVSSTTTVASIAVP